MTAGRVRIAPSERPSAQRRPSGARVREAGVWVFGGGLATQRASVVATDGTVTEGPYPETKAVIGGFSVIDVPSHEDALAWAGEIAAACRCSQEVRLIMDDPES